MSLERMLAFAGHQIRANELLFVATSVPHFMEEYFPQPEKFDIDRSRDQLKVHFGFGHGLHFCLGAPLARLEGQIAFQRLFDRVGEIRLASGKNDFKHIASTHFRALRELHLEFDRA